MDAHQLKPRISVDLIKVVVTGAGGFQTSPVKYLKARDDCVRGVDSEELEYEPWPADEFERFDLRRCHNCLQATRGLDEVYAMAGIGF
jgi:GDP-D-mannose 3', 5'-epimerase